MAETHTLEPGEWEFWDTWMRAQRLLTRELERGLQRDCGISKAEFSLLVTLWQAAGREMRVGEPIATVGYSLREMETLSAKVHQAMEDPYYSRAMEKR